jgi:hypothetical protein
MLGSAVVYTGLVVAFFGAVASIRSKSRRAGLALAASGVALTTIGFLLPTRESRVRRAVSQLDRFIPVWQFNELHTISVAAPPEKVYEAIRHVRADEVRLFRVLTWIRRGGKDLQGGILDPSDTESLIDAALKGGFVTLADEPPHELVVGTIIAAPRIREEKPMRDLFLSELPDGYTVAAMNFAVAPDGKGGSRITTETRVFSSSDDVRRKFALYWRTIYPGSALIRRMWLRAIAKRALQ